MGAGRVRDLLSVPPERRALTEERLPNNRRRMAVDSLRRERVQGLTDVMLLLERAGKAAEGAPGHRVIEISLHRGASRVSSDSVLQVPCTCDCIKGVQCRILRRRPPMPPPPPPPLPPSPLPPIFLHDGGVCVCVCVCVCVYVLPVIHTLSHSLCHTHSLPGYGGTGSII
jgi:hypothetical protein